MTLSRGGVELLFRVFGDRYEHGSLLVTSNLPWVDSRKELRRDRLILL